MGNFPEYFRPSDLKLSTKVNYGCDYHFILSILLYDVIIFWYFTLAVPIVYDIEKGVHVQVPLEHVSLKNHTAAIY